MELFDTHCHIHNAAFATGGDDPTHQKWQKAADTDPQQIIARARQAEVTRLLCVGTSLEDSEQAIDFVKTRENIWAAIGIHPHEAARYRGKQALLDRFAALAERTKVIAVGECGLDYFYAHSPKIDQLELLDFQLSVAHKHQLSLSFHVREAFDDFWPIFDKYTGLHGVLHSFTDTQANLDKALERGLYVGVNGIATFTKSEAQLTMYQAIPQGSLLLETDAPYLTPAPHRGKICEPCHVAVTANFLSSLRDEPLEELAAATTTNARQLFNV